MASIAYATPLIALDAVVMDTETTGLDARKARIIQIGAVKVVQGRIAEDASFDRLINPQEPIPKSTTAVHGITDDMVSAAPPFALHAADMESFFNGALLIGHTISYDIDMLKREYALAGRSWPRWRTLDVRMLARLAAPSLADHGLDRLCEWLGIENRKRHSALGDARATAEVFIALLPLLRARGIRTLGEAEKAGVELAEKDARAGGGLIHASPASADDADRTLVRIDSFPYRHRVRDLMSAPPAIVTGDTPLSEVMRQLLEKRISSVLVDLSTGAAGILTERDLLRALHQDGASAFTSPVERHASTPLQSVADDAFVYQAIGRIERLGLRHLAVRGGEGALVGVVTTRNLLRNRSTTAIVIGDEIEAAQDAVALAAAWSKLPVMARGLLSEAVDALTICAVISSEIRNITARAAQLAERRMLGDGTGPPPVPYAIMVLGSGGRGESQLAADQDNAIVYADGGDAGQAEAYFEELGTIMCGILDAAGIVFCKGGVMAKNRAWRMSTSDWLRTVDGWISRHRPEDLLNVDIFFDAVAVHGDSSLASAIWQHAYERAHRTIDFQKLLTEVTRRREQPFTLLGNFRLDGKGRIDLKKVGLMPIFSSARVLSIRHDARHRSTPDRLQAVAAKGAASADIVQQIIEAQRTLLEAVLVQQLADLDAGTPLSTLVEPKPMDKARRAGLKRALAAADEAIGLVAEGLV